MKGRTIISKKKFLALVMAILVLVMSLSTTAFAADNNVTAEDGKVYVPFGEEVDTYDSLEAAMKEVGQNPVTLYLVGDDELATDVEISAGQTLVIATSEDYEADNTKTGNNTSSAQQGDSAYSTLTILSGATLTVNGTVIVAGNQYCAAPNAGVLTGNYGAIVVDGSMKVNGELYARGSVSGTGKIEVSGTGDVYQMLQIHDWRGGTAMLGIYTTVFPFSCYTVNNITCNTTYEYGAELFAQYYITYSVLGRLYESQGNSKIVGSTSAEDTLYYMASEGTSGEFNGTDLTLHGDFVIGAVEVTISTPIRDYTLSTANLIGPVYNINLNVTAGSKLEIPHSLKLLPDSSLTVNGSVSITSGATMYFYTVNGYSSTYNQLHFNGTEDAYLRVNEGGSITGTVGSTSDTFSNFYGLGELTYTGTPKVPEATQTGSSTTVVDVDFYTVTLTAPTPAE